MPKSTKKPQKLEPDEDLFFVATQMEVERLTNIIAEDIIYQENPSEFGIRLDKEVDTTRKRIRNALLILISAYYLRGKKTAEDEQERETLFSQEDIILIDSLSERGFRYIDDILEQLRNAALYISPDKDAYLKNLRSALVRTDNRFRMMAGAESMYARNEAQLLAYRKLGGVFFVRWIVVADDRLCLQCAPNSDLIFRIEEASGKIPLHPYCRCRWIVVTREELINGA